MSDAPRNPPYYGSGPAAVMAAVGGVLAHEDDVTFAVVRSALLPIETGPVTCARVKREDGLLQVVAARSAGEQRLSPA